MLVLVLVLVLVIVIVIGTAQTSDHERLPVNCLSINDVPRVFEPSQSLAELQRHARYQWLRAPQSFPVNNAELSAPHDTDIDYEHEHRCAEHEHEHEF